YGSNNTASAFSPDGKMFAQADPSGEIQLWDLRTNQRAGTLRTTNPETGCLTFSPDGTVLAEVATQGTTINLWEVHSQRLFNAVRSENGGYIYGLAFSSDGRIFVAGHRDNIVSFWDATTWTSLGDCDVPMGFASALAFSPDNKTLAVAGNNSIV